MSDSLPDKVIDLEVIRINRNIDKRCKCADRTFIVDTANRCINCGHCGALVDPYEAMLYLAEHGELLQRENRALLEQRRQIIGYQPHLLVFRELEQNYRSKKMIPCCPKCGQGFFFEEIGCWTNRRMEEERRKRDQERGKG
jgi:ribosomal protein S27AE